MSAQPSLFQPSLADVFAAHPGRVHLTDPITSRQAALRNAPRSGTQRAACLTALAAAGDRGLTGYECWQQTPCKWPHVATTRVAELVRLGLAEVTDGTRAHDGDDWHVYRATDVGVWVSDEMARAERDQ